ncbi:tellurite resistance/C4-dicarboxylate transporter family protein [Nocardia huaxiensis]|uniref:Tellurite resistance/C4-dicarboxylate transporter family protein n=3 Tax=Nocardia huaxiensis TaxID=2755382 RepID=A0A7D6V6B2_9NOCA|nr:tellurite resistance/C4-dicarboxylate transporter family protein [Nocardia huaxiensis]QLY27674.1 tellurite resistance/C4-dicarboxylate transporter family protein [Nocardia huaxiensis]
MVQRWWRGLSPAVGAYVMATGIISVGLHLTGNEGLSRIALVLAVVIWIVLAADFAYGLLWDRSRWESEADTPPALTAVAATTVLGTRFALLGWHAVAVGLLVVAVLVWPVLLTLVIRHWHRHMPGAAFLVCVATQGISVLTATLALEAEADWPAVVALLFFVLGLALYLAALVRFDPAQIWRGEGDQWVFTGALAISALAGSKLVASQEWTGVPHTVLRVVTLALVAVNLLCYAVLVIAEIVRFRPGYNVRRWATVFPLGMTAVAAMSTGAVTDIPALHTAGKYLLIVAIAVWALVAAELVATRFPIENR